MKQRRIAYFDCFAGVSGDMVLGAFLDLGLPLKVLNEGWRMLGLKGFRLKTQRVQREGLMGMQVEVEGEGQIRNYREMKKTINDSALPRGIKDLSLKILHQLAQVEANIHGMEVDEVHFHEIGGIDTIVDAIGAALGVSHFEWDVIICSPLPLGRGWVEGGHGRLPLPAPATVALLKGVPIVPAAMEGEGETVTPTGAAIVTSLASGFGPLPQMEVTGVGYGAGTRNTEGTPNLLRIIQGVQKTKEEAVIWVLEADVDDMSPEFFPYLNELLLQEGALDVAQIPIQMKKGRPGFTIRVLSTDAQRERLTQIILQQSTTLGVRMHQVERMTLPREEREVRTQYGPIKVKVAFDQEGKIINLMPEYESCRQAAQKKKVPLKEAYQEAISKGRETIKQKG
jgi:uncharacterized protein (TIGR00299 family) protein